MFSIQRVRLFVNENENTPQKGGVFKIRADGV